MHAYQSLWLSKTPFENFFRSKVNFWHECGFLLDQITGWELISNEFQNNCFLRWRGMLLLSYGGVLGVLK